MPRIIIHAARGGSGVGVTNLVLSGMETYDVASNNWWFTGITSLPRQRVASTVLLNGTQVIIGGDGVAGVLRLVETFNPQTNTIAVVPTTAAPALYGSFAVTLSSGAVLLMGGFPSFSVPPISTTYTLDVNTLIWTELPSTSWLLQPRGRATAVVLGNSSVLLIGGDNGNSTLSSCEVCKCVTFFLIY